MIIFLLLAGGGAYAAAHGLLGVWAQSEVTSLKTTVLAEFSKVEATASADVKALIAAVKAKL